MSQSKKNLTHTLSKRNGSLQKEEGQNGIEKLSRDTLKTSAKPRQWGGRTDGPRSGPTCWLFLFLFSSLIRRSWKGLTEKARRLFQGHPETTGNWKFHVPYTPSSWVTLSLQRSLINSSSLCYTEHFCSDAMLVRGSVLSSNRSMAMYLPNLGLTHSPKVGQRWR